MYSRTRVDGWMDIIVSGIGIVVYRISVVVLYRIGVVMLYRMRVVLQWMGIIHAVVIGWRSGGQGICARK
jgi:hypothetical protein